MVTVSAPGKIHLLGEHAVVYGKPALLSAINKRLYVRITNCELGIKNKEKVIIKSSEEDTLIRKTIEIFKTTYNIRDFPSIEISVTSQIPVGSGLGSSAALAVALSGALQKFIYKIWNPVKINEHAYQIEKIQHGSPSGADNSIVTMGGLLWYRKEFEFLKSIWSLPIKSYNFPKLILINSGKPHETTADMVKSVAGLYKKKKKYLNEIFNSQENLTKMMLMALKNDDRNEFCQVLIKGESNLENIGVVGKLAQKFIREIESAGGVAKICGAGGKKAGSGMLLCYHADISKLEKLAKKRNLDYFPVNLGEEGVRLEIEKLTN